MNAWAKTKGVVIVPETEGWTLPLWLLAQKKSMVDETRILMEWDKGWVASDKGWRNSCRRGRNSWAEQARGALLDAGGGHGGLEAGEVGGWT